MQEGIVMKQGLNDKDSAISPSTAMRRMCLCVCDKDDPYHSSEM